MGYKAPGVLLEVVVIKREVKALALNCARGNGGHLAILCSDRMQKFKSDHAFRAYIYTDSKEAEEWPLQSG